MMAKTMLLLMCLILTFSVDAEDKSTRYRKPTCGDMSLTQACPLNYDPICGSDGITYANECALCVHRLHLSGDCVMIDCDFRQTNADIMIMKDGSC